MRDIIKQAFQDMIAFYGEAVFANPKQFKGVLSDVLGNRGIAGGEAKRIRNLLNTAVIDMNAYSRLKAAIAKNEFYAVGNLVSEMDSDYNTKRESAEAVMDCIAELFGYTPPKSDRQPETPTPIQINKPQTVAIGSNMSFGGYDWRVLDIQGNQALLLSELILEKRAYDEEFAEFVGTTWENCTLRRYLNNEFYNSLSANDRSCIIAKTNVNYKNPWYGTNGGRDTQDKVFLLSLDEVVKYFGDSGMLKKGIEKSARNVDLKLPAHGINKYAFHDKYSKERIAYDKNGTDSWWWLRSPGLDPFGAAVVFAGGIVGVIGIDIVGWSGGGVRPALWLNLES